MKDLRIVTSLDRVALPKEREDALLAAILLQADRLRASAQNEKENVMIENQTKRPRTRVVSRRAANGRERRMRRATRWLGAVAAVLVLLIVLVSIPGVSKAISDWFNQTFRLERYMSAPPEEREQNPDIEQAIRTAAPEEQRSRVQFLDETEWYAEVDAWRVNNRFPAYDRADYAWIGEMNPTVGEVLYDGRNLIVHTLLNVSPARFTGGYGGEGERFDMYTNRVRVTVDGAPYEDYENEGGYMTLHALYFDVESQTFDMDAVNQATQVTVQTSLTGSGTGPAFPSGPVEVEIEIWIYDGEIDDMAMVGLVGVVTQRVTFDATSGNAMLGEASTVTQQLSGTAPLTIYGDGWIENRITDLSTISVTATVVPRTTGVGVSLHYDYELPEDIEDERDYWFALAIGAIGKREGIRYELIVDGQSHGLVRHASNSLSFLSDPMLEIPLTESELAGITSLTLRPSLGYLAAYAAYGANDGTRETATPMPENERVYDSPRDREYYDIVPLPGCDIVLPLN